MRILKKRIGDQPRKSGGFALIATISILVLLALIAVGLLSLSTVTLRAAKRQDSMATARANARMALLLAIGELQKNAGPDQRITARADILDAKIANPRLTGVWESWDIDANDPPSPADYEESARNDAFLGWLTSSLNYSALEKVDFAKSELTDPATLWGEGSLGDLAAKEDIVKATKVPINSKPGALAWAVMDEGVKARVNTPFVDASGEDGNKTFALGSGQRPNIGSMPTLGKLDHSFFEDGSDSYETIEKGISRQTMELAAEELATGTGEALKLLTHDLTTASVGLFTNTAKGGLKEDFNLLTNKPSLPVPYAGNGVYETLLDMKSADAPSDPRWESLQQLARLYTDTTNLSSSRGAPVLKARKPSSWIAARGSSSSSGARGTLDREPPEGVVLMPTVAKVQVVFSLLTRDIYSYRKVSDTTPKAPESEAVEAGKSIHGPWARNFAGSEYDYLLHLLYTPVVTLHNPYNVALEFSELKVLFGNVPFGLQVFRNGVAQTTAPAPLDKMYFQEAEKGKVNKRFGMTLKTNGGSTGRPRVGSSTFRMLPGEVMMFSPYIDPNLSWNNRDAYADWRSNSTKTLSIDGIPGWRGDGIGFDLDWFCPADIRVDGFEREGRRSMSRGGCIGARADDEWSVKFAPLSVPGLSDNKFTVELFARAAGSRRSTSSSAIEMDYETPTGLQDSLLGPGGAISYPKEGTINTMEMHSHASTPIKDIATVKPFAIVSAQAKTTLGGFKSDGEDGELATKPWCFGHANIGSFSGNMVNEHAANHSHEFAIQRLDSGTNNLLQFDPATGRGNFISGLTGNTGAKFGVQYDIPLAPLQSLVSLNSANPGGSSGYLPRFAHPIGNSWAHPLLDPTDMSTSSESYPYLDHSYLLNLALYDHFYFSGLADQTGNFGSGRDAGSLAQDLIDSIPLADPRLALHRPNGRPATDLLDIVDEETAHTQVGGWQVMNGAFNINSTSVAAWKAMLGSIHDGEAIYNRLNKATQTSAFDDLSPPDFRDNEARISRFRLPVSESELDGADPVDAYWLGPREYSDKELELLAENIVEQVRERGPFRSMSEFVNRRLGTDEKAQSGALQRAIDESNLNEDVAAFADAGYEITAADLGDYRYRNVEAGTGPSYQGAPGFLTQADVLAVLGNAATPRSDTFTIRGYGEARDASNNVLASAVCEAVVQRVPEYVDSSDAVEVRPADLTSQANQNFGRRFQVTSFRWLVGDEI